jgi:hypothetical protein
MYDFHAGFLRKPPLEDWEEIVARFDQDQLRDRDMIQQGPRKVPMPAPTSMTRFPIKGANCLITHR